MSANGIRAAEWIRRIQARRAAILAGDLRNAAGPILLAAGELADLETDWDGGGSCCAVCGGDPAASHHGHAEDCPLMSVSRSLRESVDFIMALVEALHPGGVLSPLPADETTANNEVTGRQARAELPTVPEREVRRCASDGDGLRLEVLARPERDSSGGHSVSVPDPDDCIEGYRG